MAAGTSVGIAIALYPLLKKVNAGLALTSVVFRAIEAVLYTTAVVGLLSLVPLSKQLAASPGDSRAPIQVMGLLHDQVTGWVMLPERQVWS